MPNFGTKNLGDGDKPSQMHNREVGARIRKARLAAGRSMPQLGRVLGVSYQQIEKYEMGLNSISTFYLIKIANDLNISLLWLLQGDENDHVGLPSRLTKIEFRLLTEFRGFKDTRNRTLVRRMVTIIATTDAAAEAPDEDDE